MKEPLSPGDFYVNVSRTNRYPLCEVFSWSVRRKLPKVPVPLDRPDGDIVLDLAEAFAVTFQRGGYARSTRYDLQLAGNLLPADREWVGAIVKPSAK